MKKLILVILTYVMAGIVIGQPVTIYSDGGNLFYANTAAYPINTLVASAPLSDTTYGGLLTTTNHVIVSLRKITDFKRASGIAFVNRTAWLAFLDSFATGPGVLAIGAPVQDAIPNKPLTVDALGNLVQYTPVIPHGITEGDTVFNGVNHAIPYVNYHGLFSTSENLTYNNYYRQFQMQDDDGTSAIYVSPEYITSNTLGYWSGYEIGDEGDPYIYCYAGRNNSYFVVYDEPEWNGFIVNIGDGVSFAVDSNQNSITGRLPDGASFSLGGETDAFRVYNSDGLELMGIGEPFNNQPIYSDPLGVDVQFGAKDNTTWIEAHYNEDAGVSFVETAVSGFSGEGSSYGDIYFTNHSYDLSIAGNNFIYADSTGLLAFSSPNQITNTAASWQFLSNYSGLEYAAFGIAYNSQPIWSDVDASQAQFGTPGSNHSFYFARSQPYQDELYRQVNNANYEDWISRDGINNYSIQLGDGTGLSLDSVTRSVTSVADGASWTIDGLNNEVNTNVPNAYFNDANGYERNQISWTTIASYMETDFADDTGLYHSGAALYAKDITSGYLAQMFLYSQNAGDFTVRRLAMDSTYSGDSTVWMPHMGCTLIGNDGTTIQTGGLPVYASDIDAGLAGRVTGELYQQVGGQVWVKQ